MQLTVSFITIKIKTVDPDPMYDGSETLGDLITI